MLPGTVAALGQGLSSHSLGMIFGKKVVAAVNWRRGQPAGSQVPRGEGGEKIGEHCHCKAGEEMSNFPLGRGIVVVQFLMPKGREGEMHPSVRPCSTQRI